MVLLRDGHAKAIIAAQLSPAHNSSAEQLRSTQIDSTVDCMQSFI